MAARSAFPYANFAATRSETAFLELTDTVRSRFLQLRRHEMNYLLYAPAAGADEAAAIRQRYPAYERVSGLVEANVFDWPLANAARPQSEQDLAADHQLVLWLQELDSLIAGLRKTGESILTVSKDLDRDAREKVGAAIGRLQTALFVL